jgi:hypothetical protein
MVTVLEECTAEEQHSVMGRRLSAQNIHTCLRRAKLFSHDGKSFTDN